MSSFLSTPLARLGLALCLAGATACGSDDSPTKSGRSAGAAGSAGGSPGTGGSAGMGGSAGRSGTGGSGSGGSVGQGGSGSGGSVGTGGSGTGGAVMGGAGMAGASGSGGASMDAARPADAASASGSDARSGDGAAAGGNAMSFFVSSKSAGEGGNLGGLKGADKTCEDLAKAVNARRQKWVAYLSAKDGGNGMQVNARDRIGKGPWYNQKGEMFAESLEKLHPTINPAMMRAAYIAAKPADALFLDEKGARVPGNQHDILTGTKADGTLDASTCMDWTSAAMNAKAMLGHSDTPGNMQFSPSWNAAHESSGCAPMQLASTGGNGRIYCFATD